ncbi:ComF family protein [Paenisporosarcina indica]|uniref:ComF family protein n=1 Tax=Paenisporosarcina indica TaxID=650093 RepID=UPI00094F7AC0|nr:phosphoribosyltransferase family protein [Paenisporosarcina indica]
MNCLICSAPFLEAPSWQRLFTMKQSETTCEKCKSKFEKATDKEHETDWIGTIYEGALDSLTSIYSYNMWMKQVYQQYKFQHDVELAKVFAADFSHLKKNKNLIVPIPLHQDMLKSRTFSQVDQLLLAARVPFTQVLTKITNSSQIKKSKKERIESEINYSVCADVQSQTILLVDDLYTTGTTLRHIAFILKEAGAQEVNAITLIRA